MCHQILPNHPHHFREASRGYNKSSVDQAVQKSGGGLNTLSRILVQIVFICNYVK